MINIVLYEPEIPENTGNIMRTCATTNSKLHLIEPLGFILDEKRIRRSGVNYIDKVDYQSFRPKVRPPRLGGNQSVGVFATRSPFRPNRIGLSIVKLNRIIKQKGKVSLEVIGADLVDGTPIVDVKPYIPFVDSVKDAVGGFAKEPPKMLLVEYKDDTKAQLIKLGENEFLAIEQSLRQDPRPAYKEKEQDTKIYQARLYEMVISFVVKENTLQVIKVEHA